METMKAIEYYAPGDIRVGPVPIPQCGAEEIRAKVDACAVCGTDLKTYLHGNPRIKAPRIMGHEFTAIVETVGEKIEDFRAGQRIVMATSVSCGTCSYCSRGLSNLCGQIWGGICPAFYPEPFHPLNNYIKGIIR